MTQLCAHWDKRAQEKLKELVAVLSDIFSSLSTISETWRDKSDYIKTRELVVAEIPDVKANNPGNNTQMTSFLEGFPASITSRGKRGEKPVYIIPNSIDIFCKSPP